MNITKNELKIIDCFRALPVPAYIKSNALDGLDLMLCYEELKNQLYNFENGFKIRADVNSWGDAENLIFDGRYEKILINLLENSTDNHLRIFCDLALACLILIKQFL